VVNIWTYERSVIIGSWKNSKKILCPTIFDKSYFKIVVKNCICSNNLKETNEVMNLLLSAMHSKKVFLVMFSRSILSALNHFSYLIVQCAMSGEGVIMYWKKVVVLIRTWFKREFQEKFSINVWVEIGVVTNVLARQVTGEFFVQHTRWTPRKRASGNVTWYILYRVYQNWRTKTTRWTHHPLGTIGKMFKKIYLK
jgi:hypothetical protein